MEGYRVYIPRDLQKSKSIMNKGKFECTRSGSVCHEVDHDNVFQSSVLVSSFYAMQILLQILNIRLRLWGLNAVFFFPTDIELRLIFMLALFFRSFCAETFWSFSQSSFSLALPLAHREISVPQYSVLVFECFGLTLRRLRSGLISLFIIFPV